MNLKKLPELTLLFSGVFYYYISALFGGGAGSLLLPVLFFAIVTAGVLIVRYLLSGNPTTSTLKFIGLFLLVFVAAYYFNWPNIIWIALMAVPLLSITRDQYIKGIFFTSSILFTLTVSLSLFGVLQLEYINFAGEVEERYGAIRYSLGFDGPNQAMFAFFTILLSGLYTYGHKKVFTVVITILTLVIGLVTGSRTGLICSIFFIVFFLSVAREKNHKKRNLVLPWLFVICAVISAFSAVAFANNDTVNELLTGRPQLIDEYMKSEYVPTAFGSDAVYNKVEYQTKPLDNFPVYVFGKYGVVGFIGIVLLFYIAMRRESSRKIKCMFVFVMLYGMFEAFFDIPAKNFLLPIFMYSVVVYSKEKI